MMAHEHFDMIGDILVPFLTVGVAELGDKTQLIIFSLAAKTTDRRSLLLGVLAAFFLLTLVAVAAGNTLTEVLPPFVLKLGSGLLFILFGLLSFLNSRKQEAAQQPIQNPFLSGFMLILLAEMGDKSQLASGLLATRFNPVLVFIGTLAALYLLSAGAVWAGQWIFSKIPGDRIHAAAGLLFIAIGLGFILF